MQSYSWKQVREKTLILHKTLTAAILKLCIILNHLIPDTLYSKLSKGLAQDLSGPPINVSL